MKGILFLLVGIASLLEVGYHIYRYKGEPGSIFGLSIPNIPYLLIWGTLGGIFLYNFYLQRKEDKTKG